MKRHFQWILIAALLCGTVFAACNKQDTPAPIPPDPPFTSLEGKYIRTLESGNDWATILYTGMGAEGSIKELSALVRFPDLSGDKTADGLAIGCHITITSDAERPSNYKNLDYKTDVYVSSLLLTGLNKLVVFPDYEGYGSTAGNPHPYLQRELTARQVIAGAKAALEWLQKEKNKSLANHWKSVAFGYSQGGAVAAGVVRYYQENQLDGLNLIAGACGDGPYDPLATLHQYISDDKLYMPVSAALVVKGLVDTNPETKALGCTYADFMTEGFIATGIFETLGQKEKNTDDIHAQLLAYSKSHDNYSMMVFNTQTQSFLPYNAENTTQYPQDSQWKLAAGEAMSYCKADQCFNKATIDFFKDGTAPAGIAGDKLRALKSALEKNSLTYGNWKPSQTTQPSFLFFHAQHDEVVPFCNYETVKSAWGIDRLKGYTYTAESGTHVNSGIIFVLGSPTYVNPLYTGTVSPGEEVVK